MSYGLILSLVVGCSHPHHSYYREHGTLHPELLTKMKAECLVLGFKDNTTKMAECRKDLAQDWKNNVEANRRSRDIRPTFGIHYGIGHRW